MTRALGALAGALAGLALLALAAGGLRVDAGPVHFSATNAGRLVFQASLCWLVATLLAVRSGAALAPGRLSRWLQGLLPEGVLTGQRSSAVLVAMVAALLGAIADSHPQRVGDGTEYVAMALNLSRLQPPALSAGDIAEAHAVFDASPGFERARLPTGVVGADGRQDTHHFWLYSLLVAPGVAAARAAGVHPNDAFTLVNGLLLAGLAVLIVSWGRSASDEHRAGLEGAALGAGLIVAGPPLWWLDKAHAEVFLFVTIAVAMLTVERRPRLALVSAGLASAQNPAGLVVLGAVAADALSGWSRGGRPAASMGHQDAAGALQSSPGVISGRSEEQDPPYGTRAPAVAAGGVALLIAFAAPAYYTWHLGSWSPLAATLVGGVPHARALLAPLVDLNLGLVWHAPILVALAVMGFVAADVRFKALVAVVTLALLLVFAQVANVNHGGTPGMSRYALWLLAAWTPLIALGADRVQRSRRVLAGAVVSISVVLCWFLFRPSLADRAGASPNALASFVWRTLPSLENPLPEVFAERLSGIDGQPPIPVATPGCEKVLTRGDGTNAAWPFPCEPRAAPEWCGVRGALCYAHGDAFAAVPVPPSLVLDSWPPHAWTTSDRRRLDALLPALGARARHRRSTGAIQRIALLDDIEWSYVVEGETGTVAWVRARPEVSQPLLRLRLAGPAHVEIRGANPAALDLQAGTHDVSMPTAELILVVVADVK